MSDTSTAEERLRQVAERLRARARQLPAGAPLDPDPDPEPSASVDRPPAGKPERGAPRHWSELDDEEDPTGEAT